jgi:rhamnosyltransferase
MSESHKFSVSVVIPVKNGGSDLFQCLKAITNQQSVFIKEIIVLDSNSIDDSVAIARSFDAKIISIESSVFNHGLTRNIGVNAASGDLVYFTVQDAYIADMHMLQKMVSHFYDTELKAVVGIQGIPKSSQTNPALWFQRMGDPDLATMYFPGVSYNYLSERERINLNCWDNVNALYRKGALLQIPFRSTNYCEDKIWADEALRSEWKLLKDSSLLVYHYHHMFLSYTISQKYIIDYFFYTRFKILPSLPNYFSSLFKSIWSLLRKKDLSFINLVYWILHNSIYLIAEFMITFLFLIFYFVSGSRGLQYGFKLFCPRVPQGLKR